MIAKAYWLGVLSGVLAAVILFSMYGLVYSVLMSI